MESIILRDLERRHFGRHAVAAQVHLDDLLHIGHRDGILADFGDHRSVPLLPPMP